MKKWVFLLGAFYLCSGFVPFYNRQVPQGIQKVAVVD